MTTTREGRSRSGFAWAGAATTSESTNSRATSLRVDTARPPAGCEEPFLSHISVLGQAAGPDGSVQGEVPRARSVPPDVVTLVPHRPLNMRAHAARVALEKFLAGKRRSVGRPRRGLSSGAPSRGLIEVRKR